MSALAQGDSEEDESVYRNLDPNVANEPMIPRSELREQQDREYEEALRQDQLAELNDPTSSLRKEMRRLGLKKLPKGVKTLPNPYSNKKRATDRAEERVLKQTKGKILRKKFNHLKYGFMTPLCGTNGYMQPMFVEQHGELVNVLGEHPLYLDDEYDSDEEEIHDFDLYSLFKENGINKLIHMKKNVLTRRYIYDDDDMYDDTDINKKVSESESESDWDSDSNQHNIDNTSEVVEEQENPFEKTYYDDGDQSTDED